jgi:hypothetical protein
VHLFPLETSNLSSGLQRRGTLPQECNVLYTIQAHREWDSHGRPQCYRQRNNSGLGLILGLPMTTASHAAARDYGMPACNATHYPDELGIFIINVS